MIEAVIILAGACVAVGLVSVIGEYIFEGDDSNDA